MFVGCLIDESLADPSVVADWAPFAEKVVAVPNDPDAEVWHVRWFQVAEGVLLQRLDAIAAAMKPNWYGHFWAGERLCVILPRRLFWLDALYASEWDEMIEYGESVGVERRWTTQVPTTLPEWVAQALAGAELADRPQDEAESAEPEPPRIAREAAAVAGSEGPRTRASLAADLRSGGIRPGMHLLVHSRLSALGWVAGGSVAVIQALQDGLTSEGSLMMPAFSGDLSDPAHWSRPPVPADWWATIRREMPPFDPLITPTRGIGRIPELFRTWPGVRRSNHPHLSFSAWGREALLLTVDHHLQQELGEDSPLGRLYRLDGWILLLGTNFETCTALHLSEHISRRCMAQRQGAPIMTAGGPEWREWDSLAYDDADFTPIGTAYLEQAAEADVRRLKVGSADSLLLRMQPFIDFATTWMRQRRVQ